MLFAIAVCTIAWAICIAVLALTAALVVRLWLWASDSIRGRRFARRVERELVTR